VYEQPAVSTSGPNASGYLMNADTSSEVKFALSGVRAGKWTSLPAYRTFHSDDTAKLAIRDPVNTRVASALNFVVTVEETFTKAEPDAMGVTVAVAMPDRPSRDETTTVNAYFTPLDNVFAGIFR
jgi:hypothetical protein